MGAAFLLVAMVLVAVPVVLALARPTRGGDLDGFPREAVAVEGDGTEFVRVGDEGGRFRFTFCPRCGSTVFFYVEEGDEARIAITVGAFADSRFPAPRVSVYEDRRHSWVTVPEDAEHWRRDPA